MDIKRFYAEDKRRRRSEEVEYGLEWRDASDASAAYAVRWIRETGEVYALRRPQPPLPMAVLEEAVFTVPISADVFRVVILGHVGDQESLEAMLNGWEVQMVEPGSLQWVRRRLSNTHER